MKHGFSASVLFLILVTNAASGTALTSNVNCTDQNGTITGTTTCANSTTAATSSGSYSTAGGILAIAGNANASASTLYLQTSTLYGSSNASSSLNLSFTSSGAVRSGFIEIDNLQYSFGDNNGGAGVGYILTNSSNQTVYSLSCVTSREGNGGPDCPTNEPFYTNPILLPVTLGTPFQLTSTVTASADSSGTPRGSIGVGGLNVTFEFFEADGVTPAAILAPEAGMWALTAFGLAALALARAAARN